MEFTYNDLSDKIDYSGNFNVDLLKVLAYLDPNKSSSYDNWSLVPDNSKSSATIKCVCGHAIVNQFRAYHMITKDCMSGMTNSVRDLPHNSDKREMK